MARKKESLTGAQKRSQKPAVTTEAAGGARETAPTVSEKML